MKRYLGKLCVIVVDRLKLCSRARPRWGLGGLQVRKQLFSLIPEGQIDFSRGTVISGGTEDLGFDGYLQVIGSLWHLLISN